MNVYDLTEAQKEILHTELCSKNKAVSNLGGLVIFQNRLDLQLMKEAIRSVIRDNDIFALRLKQDNEYFVQFFSEELPDEIMTIEFYSRIYSWLDNDMKTGFDLKGPLYKIIVLGINAYTGYYIKLHNLMADTASLMLLMLRINEILAEKLNLPEHCIANTLLSTDKVNSRTGSGLIASNPLFFSAQGFEAYLQAQTRYNRSLQRIVDKAYWLHEASFGAAEAVLQPSIAADNTNCAADVSARITFSLSRQESIMLSGFCVQNSISLTELTEAVIAVYLAQIKNADLAIVCALENIRNGHAAQNTLGLFSAIIPLYIVIDRENSFIKLCAAVREKHYQSNKHGVAPLTAMLEVYNAVGGAGRMVYEVMVSGQKLQAADGQFCRVELLDNGCTKLPLLINVEEYQEISYVVDYQLRYFKAADVQKLFICLKDMTRLALTNKNILIKDIVKVLAQER